MTSEILFKVKFSLESDTFFMCHVNSKVTIQKFHIWRAICQYDLFH